MKSRRGDPDDGERHPVDRHRASQHPGIAGEAALPVGVADHRHRRPVGGAVVVHRERPPEQRGHAEDREVVAADHPAARVLGLGLAPGVHRDVEPAGPAGRGETAEQRRTAAELGVDRVGEEVGAKRAFGHAIGATGIADDDELVGRRHRERPEQQRVDQREDGGVGPDADRQREDHHQGQPEVVAQGADGVHRVLPQLGEIVGATHDSLPSGVHGHQLGAHAVPVAELPQGFGSGGRGIEAALDQPPRPHVEVKGQLGVHVALEAAAAEAEAEARHQPVAGAVARSARPAVATNRCHDDVPRSSRLRPDRARL